MRVTGVLLDCYRMAAGYTSFVNPHKLAAVYLLYFVSDYLQATHKKRNPDGSRCIIIVSF